MQDTPSQRGPEPDPNAEQKSREEPEEMLAECKILPKVR